MKKENVKSPIKATQNNESSWVDVHDDALMVKLGIFPPIDTPKDLSVWTKSNQEKKILKSVRCKNKMHFGCPVQKPIPVQDKLIIQLKKNKQFPYTTYSIICYMHQIGNILDFFCQQSNNTKINVVAKYTFNGKTYLPNERPFWK